jgi:hypothetical protein
LRASHDAFRILLDVRIIRHIYNSMSTKCNTLQELEEVKKINNINVKVYNKRVWMCLERILPGYYLLRVRVSITTTSTSIFTFID